MQDRTISLRLLPCNTQHFFPAWRCAASLLSYAVFFKVKPYCPDSDLIESTRASELLWKMFRATLEEFDLKPEDFASCTTDSGSDIKAMCVNQARDFGIQRDWCTSHMVNKAFEHAFETSLDLTKSKNKLVVKIIKRITTSPTWRAKFDDIQVPHVHVCAH